MEELELSILNLLIFPETFKSILDECPIPTTRQIAGDVLKTLIHDDLVFPLIADEAGNLKRSMGYDTDSISLYRFQISSKGMKIIEDTI
jgi:hypothetical protein